MVILSATVLGGWFNDVIAGILHTIALLVHILRLFLGEVRLQINFTLLLKFGLTDPHKTSYSYLIVTEANYKLKKCQLFLRKN